jgi:hypothetical protein
VVAPPDARLVAPLGGAVEQLIALVDPNGRVHYAGCSTHLGHGRSMEGFMAVHFAFAYVLRPEQL